MAELLLIARLAGRRVAFPASAVEAVVELEGITPVPRAAGHVAGLSALRSRVLTVIDGSASLEFGASEVRREAIVVPLDGHNYAIIVDEVADAIEPAAPPAPVKAPVGKGWDRVATAMVEVDGELILLVDPHLLIAGPAAHAA